MFHERGTWRGGRVSNEVVATVMGWVKAQRALVTKGDVRDSEYWSFTHWGTGRFYIFSVRNFFFFSPCSVSTGATINNETRRSNDGAEGFILIIVIFTVYLQVPGPQKACCIQQDKEFQQNYSNNLLDGLRNYLSAYL